MARPAKNTVDYFPQWKPTRKTINLIDESMDSKLAFKSFRNSSSVFIKKPEVRDIVFKKSNNKCAQCYSDENLQIDHIKSVLECFKKGLIYYCNQLINLQVLCSKCNTSKKP